MARICPLSGSDAARLVIGPQLRANEIHTTTQGRIFRQNVLLGSVPHGIVADAAARLALNVTSPRGCFPSDFCQQADAPGIVWWCVSGRGTTDTDWVSVGGAGSALWGSIGGDLADQTDIVAALEGKAATDHTHAFIVDGGAFTAVAPDPSYDIDGGTF